MNDQPEQVCTSPSRGPTIWASEFQILGSGESGQLAGHAESEFNGGRDKQLKGGFEELGTVPVCSRTRYLVK